MRKGETSVIQNIQFKNSVYKLLDDIKNSIVMSFCKYLFNDGKPIGS